MQTWHWAFAAPTSAAILAWHPGVSCLHHEGAVLAIAAVDGVRRGGSTAAQTMEEGLKGVRS